MPTVEIEVPAFYEIACMDLFEKLGQARDLSVEVVVEVANRFADGMSMSEKSQLMIYLASEITVLAIKNVNQLLDDRNPEKMPCLLAQSHLSKEHEKEIFYKFNQEFSELFMRHLGLPKDSFRLEFVKGDG